LTVPDRWDLINQSKETIKGQPPRLLGFKGIWTALRLCKDFALLISIFLFFFVLMIYNLIPMEANWFGQKTQARIIDKSMGQSHGVDIPMARLTFELNGQSYDSSIDSFSQKVYDRLQPGDLVDIHVLPFFTDKPSLDESPLSPFFILGLPLPFFFIWMIFWNLNNQKRLLSLGMPVEGVVTRVEKKKARVEYLWKGTTYLFEADLKSYGSRNQPGDPILLLVNPAKPGDCMVYDERASYWKVATGFEDVIR
jgi:hypothetical protein